MDYRHAGAVYRLATGDSLYFDGEAPHGPDSLLVLPIRFISVIGYAPTGS